MQTDRSQPNKDQQQQVNWNDFNYPPFLNLMHFRLKQIPKDRKKLVLLAFGIHIAVLINTILNIIDNCIQGGLGILYSFLFFFIFNPIVLFLFYRCYMGICKEKSKLSLFIYIQPLVIIIEVIISIVDFLGFNGFIRVSHLFKNGHGFSGTLALIISLLYLAIACLSALLYFLVFKKRSILAKAFI